MDENTTRFRVVVDGFLALEVAEFFAEQVKKNAPDSLTVDVQEWITWRREWVPPATEAIEEDSLGPEVAEPDNE
jgi:hypothetical protein